MRCVECARENDSSERGWVTVLSPSGTFRVQYCPDCMADLVRRASGVDAVEEDSVAENGD